MLSVRRASERGHFDFGWLDTNHTFSFGDYYDPRHMGFRALRVINEDRVAAGAGFPTHPHRDMEILTYVLSGAIAHKDSMGTGSVIRPGDAQRMTAGSGVTHSEFNASQTEPMHFLQIWIVPNARGLAPGYEQKSFPPDEKRARLRLIAASDGRDGAITLHQDVDLYATLLEPGEAVQHALKPGRHGWLQVVSGEIEVNGERLAAGDGAAITEESEIAIQARSPAEALLFDLA